MIQINKLRGLENLSNCYYINNNLEVINDKTNYIKKYTLGKKGYYYYSLNEKNTNKQIKVGRHRIIALAFIDNPNNYNEINHIDGNKLNNNLENLEWCSRTENCNHAIKNYLHKITAIEYKLTFQNGETKIGTVADLAHETNIPWQTLYDIIKKKCTGKKYNIYSLKVNRLDVIRNNCRRVRDKH